MVPLALTPSPLAAASGCPTESRWWSRGSLGVGPDPVVAQPRGRPDPAPWPRRPRRPRRPGRRRRSPLRRAARGAGRAGSRTGSGARAPARRPPGGPRQEQARAVRADGPERQAGGPLLEDVEAGGADRPAQRRPGEEAQVGVVEDAAPVVAEQAGRDPRPAGTSGRSSGTDSSSWPPGRSTRRIVLAACSPGRVRCSMMSPAIDHVVAAADLVRDALRPGRRRRTRSVRSRTPGTSMAVDAGHVVPGGAGPLGEQAAGAAEVEDPRRRQRAEHLEHRPRARSRRPP